MTKSKRARMISLLLCAVMLFLCSCDLGTVADDNEGLAGIGAGSTAYKGLFDGMTDIYITIGDAELSTVTDRAVAEIYCKCDVKANGVSLSRVGIRARGNTGYIALVGNGRYSFKLKFNEYIKGQKLNGLDELNLNNISYDPSYIREYLAYSLFSLDSGVPAPLASFAKLYVNGEYYGLYLAVESVDESFLKRVFGFDDGIMYKAGYGSTFETSDVSTFTLERGNDASLSKLTELYEAIKSGENVEDLLDTESVLRYAAIMSVICGKGSYLGEDAENYYLYKKPKGTISVIPYDFKISFGVDEQLKQTEYSIDSSLISASVTEPYFGLDAEERPLVSQLLKNEKYKKEYLSYVKYYNDALAGMLEKLPALKSEIDEAVSSDPRRLYEDDLYQAEYTEKENTLYGFIKARCENVSSQLAEAGE